MARRNPKLVVLSPVKMTACQIIFYPDDRLQEIRINPNKGLRRGVSRWRELQEPRERIGESLMRRVRS